MRVLVASLLVLSLASIATVLAWSSKDGPRIAPSAPSTRVRSLPPGLWFEGGHYESSVLEEEPTAPRFAVILGVHGSAASAEAAARRAPSGGLAPGFPWVVTTRDVPLVGAAPDRIAVIVGLFEERAPADLLASTVPHASTVVLAEASFEQTWTDRGDEVRLWVVQIDPRRDAQGYAPSAIEALEARLARESEAPVERAHLDAALAQLRGCRIPRGTVLTTRASNHYYASSRRWAIGRCGGREVLIPVEQTLREAVFEYRSDGEVWIHQVTDVTCDSATFATWRYTSEGREVIPGREPSGRGGCAG